MRYIQSLIVALMLGGCGTEQGTPYEGTDFFAEICEGLLEWIDADQVALTGAGFLKQWVSDQLLTGLVED